MRLRPIIVDTGDGASVTVSSAGRRAARITGLPTRYTHGISVGGPAACPGGIVSELGVGPVSARDFEALIEPQGSFSDTIEGSGRIGSGFLRDYSVLLDPVAGRMVLRAVQR